MQFMYLLHVLMPVIFLPFLYFPFAIRKLNEKSADQVWTSLQTWRVILIIAHVAFVISLVTGLLITSNFLSWWFFIVAVAFLELGALLGMSLKNVRLTMDAASKKQDYTAPLKKLNIYSVILAVDLVIILLLMYFRF